MKKKLIQKQHYKVAGIYFLQIVAFLLIWYLLLFMLKPYMESMSEIRENVDRVKAVYDSKSPYYAPQFQFDQDLEIVSSNLNTFFRASMTTLFFIFFIFLLVSSLFKAMIWSIISKEKFNYIYLRNFIGLKAICIAVLGLAVILFIKILDPYYSVRLSFLLFPIYLYLTGILYACIDNKRTFYHIFKATARIAFSNIYYFLLPYSIYFAALFIASIVSGILIMLITPPYPLIVVIPLFVIINTAFKFKLFQIVKKLR